ncbi:MAG: hypothetical protein N3G19_01815 [Candidatus Pacearchaeota archaeon]|nr:hypothetical protein [Candidatus Pacearchaeota archaeon]
MEKEKLAMVIAVNKALEYKNSKPNSETEEILQHIMKEIKARGQAKIAAIAAATEAINYKERNPNVKDKEIVQNIMNRLDEILNSICS